MGLVKKRACNLTISRTIPGRSLEGLFIGLLRDLFATSHKGVHIFSVYLATVYLAF